ncbi:hypothetical protein Y900_025875 [Mycolicibacterium aromaticivorans JS19b1 = JCM 16368]|uniref:Tetratricopeptide repeat family protein n=1 Tax=Mycolicibacterium aromaticivorans JS19b1 = JCM 16368 TaxID=1440774 RepID=A0A064CNY9_9MYCO|nr:hypothetical protein [Mycolicibacterium aromaticivorans]KDF02270.1 hypothetical protein Y900_025875 [Mycolicibacterium aromaticivorans JS19b1 = JCM 16368]
MSITGDLQQARQLALAAQEEKAKDLLLSLMPQIESEDRDDLALEAFAQLGEIYLTRTAYDGTRECLRRMTDCLAAYPAQGAETDRMVARYTLRALFLRIGLAAAAGDHEDAAAELARLRDDNTAQRFADLEPEQRHLATLAGVLCATALCDDDLHVPAAHLWQDIIPVIAGLAGGTDDADQLLVAAGLAYGRFCVETGRLEEGEQWLRRAGARSQRREWTLYWARAELETAAAMWMRGDHESTERLVGSAYPVIAEHSRAHDVARCWLYFGLTRLGVGWLKEADESWGHAETQWRELGRPLFVHRILLQRSWISVFRGRFDEAVEQVAEARRFLDGWPRSSWLQYARLDDHLGSIWRADALADLNFDGIGDPSDSWQATKERQVASHGVTRFDSGSERHRSALGKLEKAAELKIPAALAVDSVRYAMTDADARWRWASQVSARMLAGAFSVAWEWENDELLSELIEYHCARGTFASQPRGEGGGWEAPATVTVPVETLDEEALAAGGYTVDALTQTTLGALPPLQMDPGGSPILARYRLLAQNRYGQAVTSGGPVWSTWP